MNELHIVFPRKVLCRLLDVTRKRFVLVNVLARRDCVESLTCVFAIRILLYPTPSKVE